MPGTGETKTITLVGPETADAASIVRTIFPAALRTGGTVIPYPNAATAPRTSGGTLVRSSLIYRLHGRSEQGSGWQADEEGRQVAHENGLKGWDYLYEKLIAQGFDPGLVASVFSDPRMPERQPLYFSLTPRESHALYRKHNSYRNRQNALGFYRRFETTFRRAESRFGVPRHVILALLQVETGCGRITGRSRVLPGLARLAIAASPENVEANAARRRAELGVTRSRIVSRARYLEDTFLPHVAGALKLAKELDVDPLELRGSSAGAMGIPQFLPGNFFLHGADGNGDGRVDPYSEEDSILSVARFLRSSGWEKPVLTRAEQRKAIWHYNRSEPYISTVLTMAALLEKIESGQLTDRPEPVVKKRGGKRSAARSKGSTRARRSR